METTRQPTAAREGEVPARGALHGAFAALLELGIEWMVRVTGRRIRRSEAPWLNCFLGEPGLIGTGIYQKIADYEQLKLRMPPEAGLIPDFEALRGPSFDPDIVDARIRHFYEHAAEYHLEVWSEVYFVGRFFLWLLVEFLSRRMDQLNFPISSLELARGMTSEVVQLYEPATGTGGVDGLAAADEIDGAGDLCGDLFDDTNSLRRESVRESDIPVPGKRECVFAASGAWGWIIWIGFIWLGVWKIGVLPAGRIGAGALASAEFHDAA